MSQFMSSGGLRRLAVGAAVAAAGTLAAAQAEAGTIKIQRDTTNYSSVAGGEFKVTEFTGGTPASLGTGVQVGSGFFQTFCLERNELLTPGVTYDWVLGTSAKAGGLGGSVGGEDPLDERTAYLFNEFWRGTLSNYDYTLGSARVASATELQNAIWYLEGELSTLSTSSQAWTWVQEAGTAVGNQSWSGLGNVRVLNVTDPTTGANRQDMLYLVPLPLGAASGLITLGLSGVAFLRRRRRARG